MTQNMKFNVGEVIVFTEGAYSNYGIDGFAVALKEFNINEQANIFANQKKDFGKYKETDGFIEWLITQEVIIPVTYRGFNIGEYDEFASDFKIEIRTRNDY